jgi:hypothetical protein
VSGSNFIPQNTQCIPVVKIFAFLELEPRLNIKTDLTGQAKLSIFQRSQDVAPGMVEYTVSMVLQSFVMEVLRKG